MKEMFSGYPVLSCRETAKLEASILGSDVAEWEAMLKAGTGIARELYRDYQELSPLPKDLNVLALIGKGNNGGDALIACKQILADVPQAQITLLFAVAPDELKALALKAYSRIRGRVANYTIKADMDATAIHALLDQAAGDRGFDLCIDGLLGMSFRPPVRDPMRTLIGVVNAFDRIGLRAAVDLPSGKGDTSDTVFFRADFSYATGIPKKALFSESIDCGRIRVIDLKFQKTPQGAALDSNERVLTNDVLRPLQTLRPADSHKYTYGHLFIVGGSVCMPGALLMAVHAALRSGVGLVTAFAPASVASSLAAQAPEAMWVPWPETGDGTLDADAAELLFNRVERASTVLIGPGMGNFESTHLLARMIIQQVEAPIVVDADGLQPEVISAAAGRRDEWSPVVLTPHGGEFRRIAKLEQPEVSNETLQAFCHQFRVITVLKGPYTRISNSNTVWYNVRGGPVLARGGSGDLLAGLIGGTVARKHLDVQTAVASSVMLHGLAAEKLARAKGQNCIHTLQLLDYLSDVSRAICQHSYSRPHFTETQQESF